MVGKSLAPERLNLTLLGLFAVPALLLAAVGLYGVIAYSVTQRTQEIGIRMALGARSGNILLMVLGYGMRLVLVGVGIGLVGSLAVTRLLEKMLYGVSAFDPLTFALVVALLLCVAVVACVIPARRAARISPPVALRYE